MRRGSRRALGAALLLIACVSCKGGTNFASEPTDLLGLPYVVVGGGAPLVACPLSLGDEKRPCVDASTPSEVRFRLQVPSRASLTFAIGLKRLDEAVEGPRVAFSIRAGRETPETEVFRREVHATQPEQWMDQFVDLRPFSGESIWLSFETSLVGSTGSESGWEPPPVVGLFAEPVLHDGARYQQGKAVVLISVDTLRRDHLSLYGYPRKTTPSLENLGAEAVVFEDAVSTSSWTLPAHASLWTSLHASVHGAVNLHTRLSDGFPSLPQLLRERGFFTQAFVTHLYLSDQYGFGAGFDRHVYLPETRAGEVTDRAIAFLRARGDRDFFLFLHYYDPHWHYDAPSPYDEVFYPAYQGEVDGVWWNFKQRTAEDIAEEDLKRIIALYDGEILYTDHSLGRLFRAMKALALFDRTLIVVTSDHGEEFLEHGGWEHQKTLYEEQLRIPLLVKLPGQERAGERVADQVSLLDVAPTILSALGKTVPASFAGRDVLATQRGPGARVAWSETEHTVDGSHKISLRQGAAGRKLIFSLDAAAPPRVELYDLARDTAERCNLAGQEPDAVAAGRRSLEKFLAQAARRRDGLERAPPAELVPEQLDKLRSLGYAR